MAIQHNPRKWWRCEVVKKDKPDEPLERYFMQGINHTYVIKELRHRFFLKDDEKWVITRDKSKDKDYFTPKIKVKDG